MSVLREEARRNVRSRADPLCAEQVSRNLSHCCSSLSLISATHTRCKPSLLHHLQLSNPSCNHKRDFVTALLALAG